MPMAKRKTTIYIDDDVITATKMTAVATHRSDSAVIEDALRSYLGAGHGAAAQVDLRAVLDRLAAETRMISPMSRRSSSPSMRSTAPGRSAGEGSEHTASRRS